MGSKEKEEKTLELKVVMNREINLTATIDREAGVSVYGPAKYGEATYGEEQPRGVGTLEEQRAEPYFKGSMEAELQKFGKLEYSQLLLGEDADIRDGSISLGLDLSETQARALHAVQKLLDDTDYRGNMEGEERTSIDFKWSGYLPTLSFTPKAYYEAYGLEPAGDGRYHGAEVQQAIKALNSLMQPVYRMSYNRSVYKKGKKSIEAIRVKSALITSLGEAYQDVTEEELALEGAGQELPDKRRTQIIITPSPIMLVRIHEGGYVLKPVTLFTEIQALYPENHHPPKAVSLFISWLLTLNKKEMRVGKDKLAVILRMDSDIKNRRRADIDRKITEALDVAKKLGYLLSYGIQPTGLIELKLNPERIKRIKSRMAREQAEKETV